MTAYQDGDPQTDPTSCQGRLEPKRSFIQERICKGVPLAFKLAQSGSNAVNALKARNEDSECRTGSQTCVFTVYSSYSTKSLSLRLRSPQELTADITSLYQRSARTTSLARSTGASLHLQSLRRMNLSSLFLQAQSEPWLAPIHPHPTPQHWTVGRNFIAGNIHLARSHEERHDHGVAIEA